MTALASSTFALQSAPRERAAARREAHEQLQEMSDVMVREKGLLNYAQAALLLDVSTKRISELVRLEKLNHWVFLGRPYVSMIQVRERFQQDLKAGRPRRSIGKRVAASVKAALKTDRVQAKLGGYAGPYVRAEEEANKKKNREDLARVWRAIKKGPKK